MFYVHVTDNDIGKVVNVLNDNLYNKLPVLKHGSCRLSSTSDPHDSLRLPRFSLTPSYITVITR
jgi:hypothetical protein